jgi:hypothetical protein
MICERVSKQPRLGLFWFIAKDRNASRFAAFSRPSLRCLRLVTFRSSTKAMLMRGRNPTATKPLQRREGRYVPSKAGMGLLRTAFHENMVRIRMAGGNGPPFPPPISFPITVTPC